MAKKRSPLILIFLIVFIDLVGFGIVIPILPLYAERFGASPLQVGLLLASYSLMQVVCAPWLGKLSDRVGRRPVLLVSLIGTAIGFLITGFAGTLAVLFVGRMIDGATGGNISTAQAYIADVTPPKDRSKGMGLIGAAFGLGFIFGPAIGGVLGHISLAAPFLFAAALAGLNAVGVARLLPESLPPERRGVAHSHPSVLRIFSDRAARPLALVLAIYFFTTVAFSLLTATFPLFTQARFQFGAIQNGWIFAGLGLLSAIVQGGLLRVLVRWIDDKSLALVGALGIGLGLLLLPDSHALSRLLLATALIGVGHGLVAAPLNGIASTHVGESSQGRVLGLMQSSASLARITGPVLGGWLLNLDVARAAHAYGRTPYWAGALIVGVGFLLTTRMARPPLHRHAHGH